jgi:hypothetical protein
MIRQENIAIYEVARCWRCHGRCRPSLAAGQSTAGTFARHLDPRIDLDVTVALRHQDFLMI